MGYITEQNAQKAATRKQLWALYCLTKKDYREEGLTMSDASKLIESLNNAKSNVPKAAPKKKSLEDEFIDYMGKEMQGIIETCKEEMKIKSGIEDDPSIFTNAAKRKSYVFFGVGCGISVLTFDKRSKIGKQIKELSSKHHMTTFLKMFLKGFTAKQIRYMEEVGFPLQAMYYQDLRIGAKYQWAVASFMEHKGVKNVRVKTYDD